MRLVRTFTCQDCGVAGESGQRGPIPTRCRSCKVKASNTSEAGRKAQKRYRGSERGKATIGRFDRSEAGRERFKRYRSSEKGREVKRAANARFEATYGATRVALARKRRHAKQDGITTRNAAWREQALAAATTDASEELLALIREQQIDGRARTVRPERHVALSLEARVGNYQDTVADLVAVVWDNYEIESK